MKKLFYTALLILAFSKIVFTNPVFRPQSYISEFMYDNNGNWVMEICFDITGYVPNNIDSICIGSSAGISKLKKMFLKDSSGYMVIRSDSLEEPLNINRQGDIIRFYIYKSQNSDIDYRNDSLAFGNVAGSLIDSIPAGCSICKSGGGVAYKDNKPTIGFSNDYNAGLFVLRGRFYDKNGKPVLNKLLYAQQQIIFNGDGTYYTYLLSRKTALTYLHGYFEAYGYTYIDTINVNANPGDTVEADIHAITDIVDAVKGNNASAQNELKIVNYPNPFNLSTNFYVQIPSSLKYKEAKIYIYNSVGRRIKSIPVTGNSMAGWDGSDSRGRTAASGIYYYQLILDKKNYKSGSMILLK